MTVGAYIPCHNAAATVAHAVAGLRAQRPAPQRVLVVDDGSTDGSADAARAAGAEVLRLATRSGRGAARRAAHDALAGCGFILCCDAANVLHPDFAGRALAWMDDPRVAAVFGRLVPASSRGAAARWRDRHLLHATAAAQVRRGASLSTWAALVRTDAVARAGGYDASLTQAEDADLGRRLLAAGYDVVHDPRLEATDLRPATRRAVHERYWRWYHTAEATPSAAFLDAARHVWRIFLPRDLRAGDPAAAWISFTAPFAAARHAARKARAG